ncbi:hypothetical protein M231_03983 [Tremella mesenterica]|uniref:Uncharacterized protein n=1 Tax=Tremella mesenterica TaxID=5217 RepID=A0A4V1M417_TREME|nr:hypothetical protein M231_03983 [Tremella mesenterica]
MSQIQDSTMPSDSRILDDPAYNELPAGVDIETHADNCAADPDWEEQQNIDNDSYVRLQYFNKKLGVTRLWEISGAPQDVIDWEKEGGDDEGVNTSNQLEAEARGKVSRGEMYPPAPTGNISSFQREEYTLREDKPVSIVTSGKWKENSTYLQIKDKAEVRFSTLRKPSDGTNLLLALTKTDLDLKALTTVHGQPIEMLVEFSVPRAKYDRHASKAAEESSSLDD